MRFKQGLIVCYADKLLVKQNWGLSSVLRTQTLYTYTAKLYIHTHTQEENLHKQEAGFLEHGGIINEHGKNMCHGGGFRQNLLV